MSAPGLRYKRPYDLAVLAGSHLALLPLWLVLWLGIPLAIWLEDRGPIFFRQCRIGKNGNEFVFLKFRTMVPDAESTGLVTEDVDSRITKVGRVLRRTALDELPQVINILKGDMSFVGPRALPTQMHLDAVKEEPRFARRCEITPGLTGIAQIYLPRHCAPRRRLGYDLLYVKRASLWLDVTLMLSAVWNTLTASWGTGHRRPESPVAAEAVTTEDA